MLPNGASITIEYVNEEIPETNRNMALFVADRIKWPMIVRTRNRGSNDIKRNARVKEIKKHFYRSKDSNGRTRHMACNDG